MKRTLPIVLLVLALPAVASAQESLVGEPPGDLPGGEQRPRAADRTETETVEAPRTQPNDIGFGERQVARRYHFPDPDRFRPRVDRRDEIDASSDRTILWPTAHTPHQHTLAVSNHMFVLSRIAYSATDDLQLAATFVVPNRDIGSHTHLGLSGKITFDESENHVFSIQPFGHYRRGGLDLPTSDLGLGVTALLDVVSSNNLVFTFGAVAFGTLVASTQTASYEDCQSREDFIDGSCRTTESNTTGFPAGGHFLGAQAGLTWYFFDDWSLRGELMTGVAAGSVLGSEWITRRVDPDDEAARFETGRPGLGLPYDTNVTLGMGLQWSNGLFAVQFSGYALTAPAVWAPESERDLYLVPMLNLGMALF